MAAFWVIAARSWKAALASTTKAATDGVFAQPMTSSSSVMTNGKSTGRRRRGSSSRSKPGSASSAISAALSSASARNRASASRLHQTIGSPASATANGKPAG